MAGTGSAPPLRTAPVRVSRFARGTTFRFAPGRRMKLSRLREALSAAADAADAAGALMRLNMRRTKKVDATHAHDIKLELDVRCQRVITRLLAQRFPEVPVLGEEGIDDASDHAAARWVVDPIDGTVNFAAKLPHFCTSIGLATPDRRPLLGVVYDPTRRELFTAVAGQGARLNGQPVRVTQTAELVDAVICSGFPYDRHTNPDNNLKEWGAFLTRIRGERRLGSAALDLCYVGAGRLDGYWEKDLKPWDVMAGMLVAREAGGTVTDYAGGMEPQRADRIRCVASNGRIHAAMLSVLQSV